MNHGKHIARNCGKYKKFPFNNFVVQRFGFVLSFHIHKIRDKKGNNLLVNESDC